MSDQAHYSWLMEMDALYAGQYPEQPERRKDEEALPFSTVTGPYCSFYHMQDKNYGVRFGTWQGRPERFSSWAEADAFLAKLKGEMQ